MTTIQVQAAFKPLYGVSFYDSRPIKIKDGVDDYLLKQLDADDFLWEWYVYRSALKGFDKPPTIVRAFRLEFPMRILGLPVGDGSAVMELPKGAWLVHGVQRLWMSDCAAFNLSFVSVTDIIECVEDRGLWGEVARWQRGN